MNRLAILLLVLPSLAAAQGIRISGTTSMQLIELRPLVKDSLPEASVSGSGDWRTTSEGTPALCSDASGFCQFERSGSRISAAPLLQDLTLAAWGWTQGLSFHADLRARTEFGADSGFVYPQAKDHFDLLDGYAELERDTWRGRLGRQWITGGLGAYNYDGGDVLLRRNSWSVEGWTGRALLAGLSEPYTSSDLASVENIPPTENGYLFGARARFRPDPRTAATLTYQRVLVGDRSGLYSERASLDASSRLFGAAADLGLTYDIAANVWNEARARLGFLQTRDYDFSVEGRHSQPFFELWTIWGAFAPVGFNEGRAAVQWHPHGRPFSINFHGGYRRYGETTASLVLRRNGWRAGTDATWQGGRWSGVASYDVDVGSGAANTDVRAGVHWAASQDVSFGVDGSATQSIYEFRVGTGRIYGLALDGGLRLTSDVRLAGDAGLYQHQLTNGAAGPDWTQRRASIRLEWTMGRDPGLTGAGAP